MIKKGILFLLIILLLIAIITPYTPVLGSYYRRLTSYSFCEDPISYRLGEIDSRFNLSEDVMIEFLIEGGNIWNNSHETDLFYYDSSADLTINMVFDDRQSLLVEVEEKKQIIEEKKAQVDAEIARYEQEVERISNEVKGLNEKIDYWNAKGGAPEKEYSDLIDKQSELQSNIDDINDKVSELDMLTESLNESIEDHNTSVFNFSALLDIKAEEGVYIHHENKIEIYIYDQDSQLIHTVAHELGHALGLGHIANPGSIMNSSSSDSVELSQADLDNLVRFCHERDVYSLAKNDFNSFINVMYRKLNLL